MSQPSATTSTPKLSFTTPNDNVYAGTDLFGNNNATSDHTLTVSAADILRLIQAHLTESGFQRTVQCLQEESGGIGLAGCLQSSSTIFAVAASSGHWPLILQTLRTMDRSRIASNKELMEVLAETHEMAILEVAEAGDLTVAYALYQLVQRDYLQESLDPYETDQLNPTTTTTTTSRSSSSDANVGHLPSKMSRARVIEQKLAALAAARVKDPQAAVPDDFYGKKTSKQKRRRDIGERLQKLIPRQPPNRLLLLLQQAIKWQVYTGQLPKMKELQGNEEDNEGEEISGQEEEPSKKKRKKRRVFDLVLGEARVDPLLVGESSMSLDEAEPIPSKPWATVKFGKKATCQAAFFLPDSSGLVTGSSDGLIEIWDPAQNYSGLRLDLSYQQKDQLLGHDGAITALTASHDCTMLASGDIDGNVSVWSMTSGKCLRQIAAFSSAAVSCLNFSPDASRLLAGGSRDGTVRELGLRTGRALKEFVGHASYVTHCAYQFYQGSSWQLLIVTGSGDGTVRIWDGKTCDVLKVLRPVSLGKHLSKSNTSIVVDVQQSVTVEGGSPSVHSILHLHTPDSTMILVPRGYCAFLVNYAGTILRVMQDDGASSDKVFVAATISSTNRWLYAIKEDGVCCVFDVWTGKLEKTIRDFGSETTRTLKESQTSAEISSILHHPTKSILAAFSSDKGQKRGQLVLWK